MTHDAARLRFKTWICASVVILSNAFGDFFLKRGIAPGAQFARPVEFVSALFQPWIALGVGLLIIWQMSRMALLSWADLSYVLPVTSIGYVVVAFVGKALLHEEITPLRWAGILLIVSGVSLVSMGTAPQTHARQPEPEAAEEARGAAA